jgi:tRNA A-37 threonylcarbamoyl transferase component Bud32
VSEFDLEETLRNLPRVGTLVKDRGYRQVWRFEHSGEAYYLKFYPRVGLRLKRMFRGNPAMREFTRLQWLQKAQVPAPRPIAMLAGFRLNESIGDAVVLTAIEPSVQLDHYLSDLALRGESIPDHHELALQLRTLVHQLARAKLGHNDLHLGNILLHEHKLFVLDGYAVRRGGLKLNDILQLGYSVNRFATTTDIQRGWELLTQGGKPPPPRKNPIARRQYRKFLERIFAENQYFGRIDAGEWNGVYFKSSKYPRRWSVASRLKIAPGEWDRAWPTLLRRIESDQFEVLKRTKSGDVLGGEIVLAGHPLQVIIKRPRRRYWYRYVSEIGRGARPRRAWRKAWNMIVRNLPTAWPILLMEKRAAGYVTDTVIVLERLPGKTLDAADLDSMGPSERDMLFRRVGRILRKIEQFGFAHFDAKASNWIVLDDEKRGPSPVMIDVDGIRHRRWIALGIKRLLRSMKDHSQYSVEDSLALCQGYAPYARLQQEISESQETSSLSPPGREGNEVRDPSDDAHLRVRTAGPSPQPSPRSGEREEE